MEPRGIPGGGIALTPGIARGDVCLPWMMGRSPAAGTLDT